MAKIKLILNLPFAWIFLPFYWFSSERAKIDEDINVFYRVLKASHPTNYTIAFYVLFATTTEFRSVFYMRIGHLSALLKFVWPPMQLLSFSIKSRNFGGGCFVQHGWSTVIDAERVGKNFWVNQNVTIGWRKDGHPIIGDNVRIGTGAVVLGKITIGDNVNIGANAIVVEDIPSNCTVCSPKAQIVKYHKTN